MNQKIKTAPYCQQQHWKPADNGVLPENTEGKWFQLSLINIFRHIKSQNKKCTFSKEGNENYALPKKSKQKRWHENWIQYKKDRGNSHYRKSEGNEETKKTSLDLEEILQNTYLAKNYYLKYAKELLKLK